MSTDYRSEEAARYRRWYKKARWKKRRKEQLRLQPLCVMCLQRGYLNDGSRKLDGTPQPDRRRHFLVADHIEPHRGDLRKFWEGELQTLCPDDHDKVKQTEEGRGFSGETAVNDGWPIDPRHPANQ